MRPSYFLYHIRRDSGVSLLEYVLGLAILAIVLVGVGLFFASQPRQLDPVFQFRAVSLAEALSEQLMAVKFDANNNPAARERCGINGVTVCANSSQASTGNINDFNVVDDFQLWCGINAIDGETLAGQLNLPQPRLYRHFRIESCVEPDASEPFKKVTIKVGIEQGSTLSFILHRYNIR
ncbi:MSHA pilin protein MshD [Oceanisphaera litoralis]|uniref:type IV pilus modification PilV family protein n=1 Tax=Oceanisphaera litoralis TaxID=225144 RepID=UPI001EF983D3|nr:prepilin-type cleavage/methylation-like protein [Oceanisphaera litoralis]MBM7454759.1 MSHA pilin protein MshD [Oceanisphaera litoralis]